MYKIISIILPDLNRNKLKLLYFILIALLLNLNYYIFNASKYNKFIFIKYMMIL